MKGLLTQTASHMEHTAFLGVANGKTSRLIHDCIQAVKSHLQEPKLSMPALVFAVIHFCGAEDSWHDIDVSMIHLRGARDIIHHLGGVHKLDEDVQNILIGMDGYRAVQLMRNRYYLASSIPAMLLTWVSPRNHEKS